MSTTKKTNKTPLKGKSQNGGSARSIDTTTTSKKHRKTGLVEETPLRSFGGGNAFFAVPVKRAFDTEVTKGMEISYVKYLFCKTMTNSQEDFGGSKLMVTNMSPDDNLSSIFNSLFESQACKVTNVEIGKERMGIVSLDNSVDFTLLTQEQCVHLLRDNGAGGVKSDESSSCLDRWLSEYKRIRPDRLTIGRAADEAMELFEQRQEEENERLAVPIVDADGFTLVVGRKAGKRTLPKPNKQPSLNKDSSSKEPKRKRKQLMDENLSFYKFERKRQRLDQLSKLKDQFKNDRKRVFRMKSERGSH